jgi:antitoxin YefM
LSAQTATGVGNEAVFEEDRYAISLTQRKSDCVTLTYRNTYVILNFDVRKTSYLMTHVSYTDLRQNLSRYLDEAVDAGAPIVVTRQGGKGNVVMISEAEFAGWQETVHLLSSPKNAERLLRGVRQAEAGELRAVDLVPTKSIL